jgi:plasmid stability protein
MMPAMRTTLTIDDKLAAALKKRAFETGKSFKEVVNEVLRAGLAGGQALPKPKPFKVKAVSMGGPRPGVNLDKALQLAGELEDEELIRKMQLRK